MKITRLRGFSRSPARSAKVDRRVRRLFDRREDIDMGDEYIAVRADAVEWLKKYYPALCEKSGLCERVAGKLYTHTAINPLDAAADAYNAAYDMRHCIKTPNI